MKKYLCIGAFAAISFCLNAQTHYGGTNGLQVGNKGVNHAFFGADAGNLNSGSNNTFIGHQVGSFNSLGNNNSFLGYLAGAGNTSGSNNTFIGYNARGSGVNAPVLNNATAIGANAIVTASNSLVLGNNVNVGIGTSAPQQKLDVNGTYGMSGVPVIFNTSSDVYANIRVLQNNSTTMQDGMFINYNSTGGVNAHLKFYANGTIERMRIDASTGNIGIATAVPGDKLHVLYPGMAGVNGPVAGAYPVARIMVRTTSDGLERGLQFGAPTTGITGPVFIKVLGTTNRFSIINQANTENFTILNSGYIGMGNILPATRLHVNGRVRVDQSDGPGRSGVLELTNGTNISYIFTSGTVDPTNGDLYLYTGSNKNVLLQAGGGTTGKVGIGTTVPGHKLDVSGTYGFNGAPVIYGTAPDVYGNFRILQNISSSVQDGMYINYGSTGGGNADIRFFANGTNERMRIDAGTGNVGIGTTTPAYKLDVCGTIRAREIFVESGWCDYVFDDKFKLRPLSEVESFIKENKHLPDVPAEKEITDGGLSLGKMQAVHMLKIEELTLYVLQLNKEIVSLKKDNEELKRQMTLIGK